jgi:hypothetical protein
MALILSFLPATAFATQKIAPGSMCKVYKQEVKFKGNNYFCSKSGKKLKWKMTVSKKLPEIKDFPDIKNVAAPLSLADCQIRDARITKVQEYYSIAYPAVPLTPDFTSTSKVTIALVPIDFDDMTANQAPSEMIDPIIEQTERWAKWYTRGKLTFNWVTPEKWIRAEKNSESYAWTHPSSNVGIRDEVQVSVGKSLVALADKNLDLSGIQILYFLYPDKIKTIKDSINFANSFDTSKGQKFLGVFADSRWIYDSQTDKSMWLMHEMIHKFGYYGHAPAFPFLFSIAHNEGGPSKTLNLWDRIVLDWLNPEDIFCTDVANLNGNLITLVPQEREQKGIQGVAIKLSENELLILESHKKDVWSKSYTSEIDGLTAMVVNTNFDTDRSGEWMTDDGKGIKYTRTANYLEFTQYNHGLYTNTKSSPAWSLNYLLKKGEHFTYRGIRIDLVSTGINDTIKLSRS